MGLIDPCTHVCTLIHSTWSPNSRTNARVRIILCKDLLGIHVYFNMLALLLHIIELTIIIYYYTSLELRHAGGCVLLLPGP